VTLTLVTGGSGYFGSLLVQELLGRGDRVRVFDLNDADDRPEGVEFVRGDIRDAGAVRRAVDGAAVIHHNVAQVPLAKDRRLFWSVNVDGTDNLLRAALAAGARKVINTSSSAVFGVPPRNPVDDSVEPRPREAYGRAKLESERLCREYAQKGLDVTIIRPRTILGHGRLGIFQILFEWIREGYNVPVLGKGDNVYQFVHAHDLADACIRAAERPGPAVYNIGAEKFGTMRETLEAVIGHADTKSRIRSLPMGPTAALMRVTSALGLSPLGPYHALMYGRSLYFDLQRPKEELGWSARYGNAEMFCESYDWYVENRDAVLAGRGASHHRSALREGVLSLVKRIL
jgi:nucleoside-diphosphate-sugar epimerase